eukprot:TRINITY_DN20196_c0_g2_i2.p1 TRINITY_DN20196_c0_g2~~TRINITY_DN20196_c0_g2_i2.p1  ORF type:complete len:239 (+),score=50.03 TRINITY_DN20196_c0_g2_i2:64-780(+)
MCIRDRSKIASPIDWEQIERVKDVNDSGLALLAKILRLKVGIPLKSLALKMHAHFSLSGSVCLTFFLRGIELASPMTTLLQFSKVQGVEHQKLELLIGNYQEEKQEIVYIQKIDIPLNKLGTGNSLKEALKVQTRVLDNGDDRLSVYISFPDAKDCDLFLNLRDILTPVYESDVKLFISGTSNRTEKTPQLAPDDIYLTYLKIDLQDRDDRDLIEAPAIDAQREGTFCSCHGRACMLF